MPSSVLRGLLHSLAHDPFLTSLQPLATVITPPTTNSHLLPPYYKDPCDYTRPKQIIQNNIPTEMNNQSICKALIISYNWLVHVEKQLAKELKSSKDL